MNGQNAIPRTASDTVVQNRIAPTQVQTTEPQMLSQLGSCITSLRDLRNRLTDINSRLRGAQPEVAGDSVPTPKIPHLAMVVQDFQYLLEQCHSEATEAQAHLS